MRYLSEKTGREFKIVIPKDFEEFINIVKKGKYISAIKILMYMLFCQKVGMLKR